MEGIFLHHIVIAWFLCLVGLRFQLIALFLVALFCCAFVFSYRSGNAWIILESCEEIWFSTIDVHFRETYNWSDDDSRMYWYFLLRFYDAQ